MDVYAGGDGGKGCRRGGWVDRVIVVPGVVRPCTEYRTYDMQRTLRLVVENAARRVAGTDGGGGGRYRQVQCGRRVLVEEGGGGGALEEEEAAAQGKEEHASGAREGGSRYDPGTR